VRGEVKRGEQGEVWVDTRGSAILRSLKKLLVLHDAWGENCGGGGSLARSRSGDPVCEPH
jgi:hypothetical protein